MKNSGATAKVRNSRIIEYIGRRQASVCLLFYEFTSYGFFNNCSGESENWSNNRSLAVYDLLTYAIDLSLNLKDGA